MIEEQVVLVDPQGRELGLQEKMHAHREGALHLAFSVLLYRETGGGREFLMQQRAMGKYHSGGLWTNTCCSHPRQGESMEQAGIRRLGEEMGVSGISQLEDIATFLYRAELDNQLVEHELDHVLVACVSDLTIEPNISEVMSYRWWPQAELEQAVVSEPEQFTAWFSQVLDYVVQY
ncbi:isopentenyl-diphosphate Delta-isomerase [Photobacterium chitinilyticum]|uniref:Isopentenyl-diphosphate Delta-isomerase n=1 Tax=Photobacterium chitinilyticum TaxID=2485123 RepID=A0A444JLL4_9GAMM|nr:isopentenyl-diphosphate Delta-isomerase [Photobacterium chitinilyticum]RWX53986.1 isopentenyl-diphosphate Delta-isomerase [Photobacterium chitinilyticum]